MLRNTTSTEHPQTSTEYPQNIHKPSTRLQHMTALRPPPASTYTNINLKHAACRKQLKQMVDFIHTYNITNVAYVSKKRGSVCECVCVCVCV